MPGAGSTPLRPSTTWFRPCANPPLSDVLLAFVLPHRSEYKRLSLHESITPPDSLVSALHPDSKEIRIRLCLAPTTGSCRARIRCSKATGTDKSEKVVLRLRPLSHLDFRPPNRCRENTLLQV